MVDRAVGKELGEIKIFAPFYSGIVQAIDERMKFFLCAPSLRAVFGENCIPEILAGVKQLSELGNHFGSVELLASFEQIDSVAAQPGLIFQALQGVRNYAPPTFGVFICIHGFAPSN
jgi:hypothetical protein